ncbi:MAG: peroxidase family protein [Tepidisphaeraceae bacterium]
MPSINFENDRVVESADAGQTLLEVSLAAGIPHVHACGGNARCSTCRVMVRDGLEHLSPRNAAEETLALRKGLDPNIRLACQTHADGPCRVRRIVIDEKDADAAIASSSPAGGREIKLAILFSDIKDFTPLSERHLPHDVIHILNRYFRLLGEAVLQHDGYIDKYIGDGMMALFGLDQPDPARACMDAIAAALKIQAGQTELNEYLARHFGSSLGTRIGIHYGEAVIGQMGHPLKQQFTAIGDSVNIASRVESACKGTGADLLVSEAVYAHVAGKVHTGIEVTTHLKGKTGDYRLHQVTGISDEGQRVWPLAKVVSRHLRSMMSRQIGPIFLRLAYHDAITYDPATNTGGMNGSIRFPEELALPENKGLAAAIKFLAQAKRQFPQVSWADLISLAGAAAVTQAGGPDIPLELGRQDADHPDPAGRLPRPDEPWEPLRVRLVGMGFTNEELVALSGAHTLGRVNGIPFTNDPFHFTNEYFRLLMRKGEAEKRHLLGSDRAMADDAICLPFIEAFAMDEALFFRQFAAAYTKLSLLGANVQAGANASPTATTLAVA